MTESTAPAAAKAPARKRSGGLNSMLLADLKAMAGAMGIAGAGSMKKAQLVEAIKGVQSQQSGAAPADRAPAAAPASDRPGSDRSASEQPASDQPAADQGGRSGQGRTGDRQQRHEQADQSQSDKPQADQSQADKSQADKSQSDKSQPDKRRADQGQADKGQADKGQADKGQADKGRADQGQSDKRQAAQGQSDKGRADQSQADKGQADKGQADKNRQNQPSQQRKPGSEAAADSADGAGDAQGQGAGAGDDDGEGGSRRNRRRRGRDRTRTGRSEPDTEVREDDVLVPAAGILDVLENYAFVRTSGYLAGTDDVYLSLALVRKYGLRSGDAVAGQVRQPREGERREKFNPMVRIDTVNGAEPEQTKSRVEFEKLTPLHPTDRLRLETAPDELLGRVIDLLAPLGKGQRGLVVAPANTGRTTALQTMAAAITANNPECHLMVVLLDERPEEVTDFRRAVKGEVIASAFDHPASDHTNLAELAVERAKRLVELGHDVVMLVDGLTRLGRAYNLAAPAGGRVLPGGVDPSALFLPKKFFGAARNIEDGGSLTIVATALLESGSATDEVILEALTGTANAEIRLRSDLAAKRVFPAVDVVASGTRREDLLLSEQEVRIVWKLRRVLAEADPAAALDRLLDRLKGTRNNVEFLTRVQNDDSFLSGS